jgi:hypothetical protein
MTLTPSTWYLLSNSVLTLNCVCVLHMQNQL